MPLREGRQGYNSDLCLHTFGLQPRVLSVTAGSKYSLTLVLDSSSDASVFVSESELVQSQDGGCRGLAPPGLALRPGAPWPLYRGCRHRCRGRRKAAGRGGKQGLLLSLCPGLGLLAPRPVITHQAVM